MKVYLHPICSRFTLFSYNIHLASFALCFSFEITQRKMFYGTICLQLGNFLWLNCFFSVRFYYKLGAFSQVS